MININDLIYWFIYCLHSYIVKVQNGKVSSDMLSNYIYIEYWNVQFLCSVIINKAKVFFPFSDICAISRFCYHVAVLTSPKKIYLTYNCKLYDVKRIYFHKCVEEYVRPWGHVIKWIWMLFQNVWRVCGHWY